MDEETDFDARHDSPTRVCRGCERNKYEYQFTLGASLCDQCAAARYQKQADDIAWLNRLHEGHQWKYHHRHKSVDLIGIVYQCTNARCGYELFLVENSKYWEPGYYTTSVFGEFDPAPEEQVNIMAEDEPLR